MKLSIPVATQGVTYSVLAYERKQRFFWMNIILLLLLMVHGAIYVYSKVYSIATILLAGAFFVIPIILFLDKKISGVIARYLFMFMCASIVYGTSVLIRHEVSDEVYYITLGLVSFLIFDPSEKKHVHICLLFPLLGWTLQGFGYDFIPTKYLVSSAGYEFVEKVNFLGSFLATVLGANIFVSSILHLKDVGIKEEEDKRIKLEDAHHELEQSRVALINSSKLSSLGEMASGIAHEINNPLAIISATTSFARKKIVKGELNDQSLTDCLDDIDSTVERISKIINGLRVVSRKGNDEIKENGLQDILTDVLSLCAEKFKNNSIDFEIVDPQKLLNGTILCSRIKLSQVLVNLINNAFDALIEIEESGPKWIKIILVKHDDIFELRLIDAGPGIPENVREKLFEPFFTTKEIGKGTGIGLSISKNMIESLGGSLELDINNPNTCFVLRIPQKK